MNFLVVLLFTATLLRVDGLTDNVGPKIWSDLMKAGKNSDRFAAADPGVEGRIVGGEQAGMKDAPWQV